MLKIRILPAVVIAAFGAVACGDDGDATGPQTTASVRFVNAITDASSAMVLTADGEVVGSSLGFGQQATTCTSVHSGTTSFAVAPTSGSGVASAALTTATANLAMGGNYTILATGTSEDPHFIVLGNNTFDGNLASTQAAIRFVNLMPTMDGETNTLNVFTGPYMFGGPTYRDVSFGSSTTFSTTAAGGQTFIFTDIENQEIFRSTGLNLEGGKVYTIAVLPTASGGFQLMAIGGC